MNIQNKEIQEMLTAIKSGSDLETACHFAGLSVNVVYKDLELGKSLENNKSKENTFEVLLWNELKKARASAIVRNVAHIQNAANKGDWKAAAWWLERSLPDNYGTSAKNKLKEIE
jgi:hypothetical protein